MTLAELRASPLVTGEGIGSPTWDSAWRHRLVRNLEVLVTTLWTVGIQRIFINGSFVEEKDHPNDIDGYFECELHYLASGDLERDLNALDPFKVWTWDPGAGRPDRDSAKRQLPMWHRYRIELYPHVGQLSGIRDEYGHELTFPSAFRKARNPNQPKGIVLLLRG